MTERTRTATGSASKPPSDMATGREVAEFLGISEVTLTGMRYKNVGPVYVRVPGGRAIRYHWDDVRRWLEAGRVETDNSRRA